MARVVVVVAGDMARVVVVAEDMARVGVVAADMARVVVAAEDMARVVVVVAGDMARVVVVVVGPILLPPPTQLLSISAPMKWCLNLAPRPPAPLEPHPLMHPSGPTLKLTEKIDLAEIWSRRWFYVPILRAKAVPVIVAQTLVRVCWSCSNPAVLTVVVKSP